MKTWFITLHVAALVGYVLTLALPVLREVKDDQHGDTPNNWLDNFFRLFLMYCSVTYAVWIFGKPPLPSAVLSLAVFVASFDYVVAYKLIKNRVVQQLGAKWYSYLSTKKWTDEIQALIPWPARMALKVVGLACAVMYFVVS